MTYTKCCKHGYIGKNHSPIRWDGYCMHCGFHPEIENNQKRIKTLEKALIMAIDAYDLLKEENEK